MACNCKSVEWLQGCTPQLAVLHKATRHHATCMRTTCLVAVFHCHGRLALVTLYLSAQTAWSPSLYSSHDYAADDNVSCN